MAAGQTVAVALPGALLPGADRPLAAARLRGEESDGMILSETELRLGDDAAGIMVLDEGIAPGTPLAEVLPLAEAVLELEITSNRPDCLAVYGVAREVHAVTGAPLAPLDESDPPAAGDGEVGDHAAVEVHDPDLCPRYMARVLTDVRVGPSPGWLRHRLEAAGMRAISNVVDITNYVMLLTGQPLHAFDLDRLAGRRVVARRAREGERIVTLDGQERVLDPSMLAICDAERPAVIAGIFGAEFAEVGDDTTAVLLEAATFDGPAILDASLRSACARSRARASRRACRASCRRGPWRSPSRLLVELAGARLVPGTLDALVPAPARPPVPMRHARVPRVLGIEIRARGVGGHPHPPRLRGDRLRGGPDRRGPLRAGRRPDARGRPDRGGRPRPRPRGDPGRAAARRRPRPARPRPGAAAPAGAAGADLGLFEAITYHLVPEADADALRMAPDDPRRDAVRLDHPMSGEMAVMRRSMLPGLLRSVARNQAHQRADGGLFEIGRTYAPRDDGLADERRFLAAVQWGRVGAEGWRGGAAPGRRPHRHRARDGADRRGGRRGRAAAERRPLLPPGAPGAPGRRARPCSAGRRGAPARAAGLRRATRRSPRSCSTSTRCSRPPPRPRRPTRTS